MAERPNVFRRLYDWVLSWADSPHGARALFLISFAESSFFPIPPDPLLLALCLGRRDRALYYGLVCSVASVLGGLFGYAIGMFLWDGLSHLFYDWIPGFTAERFELVKERYEAEGFLIVFLAGFTPIPYKVITIASGVMHQDVLTFAVASLVGRSARFFIVAGLVWRYGERIKAFLDRHFDRVLLAFTVLLVGGVVVLKYVL